MEKFWVEKAHKYIREHNAFAGVSDICFSDVHENAIITAIVSVGLPSRFIKAGINDVGVKSKEEIRFIFTSQFPLLAPIILLRDDFPRCFPHINPSISDVNPCIYEGNISELLQQSEWMNGVLNQLVDWLEKAASNELLDYNQGWEPMRNDQCSGFMLYDLNEIRHSFRIKNSVHLTRKIRYEERKNVIVTDGLCNPQKQKLAHAISFITPQEIDTYLPNSIINLSQLYVYANSIGIQDIKKMIEGIDLNHLDENKLFVILCVKRPTNIINSNSDIECLNFVIHKSKPRKKNKKRVLPDCEIGMLAHIEDNTRELMKYLSGTQTMLNESKSIALVGCGSLGSKIGMHLVRNGNGPFLCIDNDIFMPHNNARHALTFTGTQNKAELLSFSMINISKVVCKAHNKSAFSADYSKSRLIIDTTASLPVKNYFMNSINLPPVISGGLYGQGRYGILLSENDAKTTRLTDIWAYLYFQSLKHQDIQEILYSSKIDYAQIGQSCGSNTMIVDDARISLMATTMSLIIQQILENGLSDSGIISFLKYDDNYSLLTRQIYVPKSIPILSKKKRDWQVSLSEPVHEKMNILMTEKSPFETGGVLLGTVFLYAKMVVITDLLPAPSDSIEEINLFILGTEGLEKIIKDIEKKTNGKVTYLGTWHSHPYGGNASQKDNDTYNKLLFVRNYEPTICLIVTQNKILLV